MEAPAATSPDTSRKWWTLLAVCVATFMLLLDITVVNTALPKIQRELNASFSELQWVVDAYSLTLASLLLTAGSLADLLGRRRVFVVGLALFTLASAMCGLAPSAVFLDISRGVQGIGGAVMFATALALIAQEFHGAERGSAFGIWGATIGAAVAIGPLVGGALTDGLGWQWIFFVNLPVGAAAIALTLSRVAESRDPQARGVDWAGVVTFTGGLFLFVFALIRGNAEGWGSTQIVVELVAAVALLTAFVAVERRQERPMFDLSLLRKPAFAGASIAAFCQGAAMFAMFLYITLYIQNVLGYSPLQAGLRFLPLSVVSFFAAGLSGRLTARVPVRVLLGLGVGLTSIGLLLMHGIGLHSDWTTLLAGMIVAGFGVGAANPALATTAVGVVPPARSGMASGINNTCRQVGIATGIAALGAVFQHRVEAKLTQQIAAIPGIPAGQRGTLTTTLSQGDPQHAFQTVPPQARAALGEAFHAAFISGLNEILLIGFVIAAVGAVLSFALVRQRDFVAPMAAPAAAAAG